MKVCVAKCATGLFLSIFFLSVPLGAQDFDGVEELLIEGQARWELAGQIHHLSIDKDEIALHPSELFNRLPGVWISRGGSGQEHLTGIRSPVLTGSGACGSFLFLEEGIPIRPPGFCNVNALIEVDVSGAQDIAVIPGPSASVFGGNALHGAIDITPVQPGEQLALSAQWTNWGDDASADSSPYQKVRLRTGAERWALQITSVEDGGWRASSGESSQYLSYVHRSDSFFVRFSGVSVSQQTAGYITGSESYSDQDTRISNPDPDAYREAQAFRFVIGWDGTTSRLRLFARTNDMEFLQHFLPGTPLEQNSHTGFGGIYQQHWSFSKWSLDFDFSLEAGEASLQQSQAEASFSPRFPQGEHYNYDVAYDSQSLRLGIAVPFSSTDWLILDAKSERHAYDYTNNLTTGNACPASFTGTCRYARPPSRTDIYQESAWRFGGRGSTDWGGWHMAYSDGFRPPQIAELYRLQAGQTVSDLDPTRLKQFEIGVVIDGARGPVSVTGWRSRKRNDIFINSDSLIVDGGVLSSRGLDISGQWQLAEGLRFDLAWTFARHKYGFSQPSLGIFQGRDADTAPGRFGALSLYWQAFPAVEVAAVLHHQGPYYTDTANLHSYQGHNYMDLRASFAMPTAQGPMHWTLRVENLTDELYADRADYTNRAGDRYFPGRGRTLTLQFQWNPEQRK